MTDSALNPNAWSLKHRSYTDWYDVRSAIVNDAGPIHFRPETDGVSV